MQLMVFAVVSLHVLTAIFWAGTTFTIVHTHGAGAARLFRPQMGAAVIATLAGGYLWGQLHVSALGTTARVLMVGAICAIVALIVQAVFVGPSVKKLSSGANSDVAALSTVLMAHRIAALLLAVAVICMAGARYA